MAKKVLVQSKYREPVVKVGQVAARNHAGIPVMVPTLRKFFNYRCYMTPEEAEFLVESKENKKMRSTGGEVPYFFPAGFPAPVDENYEGPLAPAVSAETLSTSADPQMALAAKDQMAEAAAAMEAQEKGSNSEMGRQLTAAGPTRK